MSNTDVYCGSGNLRSAFLVPGLDREEWNVTNVFEQYAREREREGRADEEYVAPVLRLRRKRRMWSIQKGATARSRSKVLMPRTSKSDGIQFDEPWSLKCASRSRLARKNISVFVKWNIEAVICRTRGMSSMLRSYCFIVSNELFA